MTRAAAISTALWLCAAALAILLLREMPVRDMLNSSLNLSVKDLGLWIALNLIVLLSSTQRWRALLRALSCPLSLRRLLSVRLAGQTVSFLTPGPQFGGEPFQILWLARRDGVPLHKALLSLGLDRAIELWVNFSVLLLGLLLIPSFSASEFPQWGQALIVLGLAMLLLSLLLYTLLRQPQRWIPPLRTWCQRWQHHPRLSGMDAHWAALSDDLNRLLQGNSRVLSGSLFLSFVGWSAIVAELWLLLSFCGIDTNLPGFALIAVSIRIAMLLPLPGGLGTIEAAVLWTLPLLGFEATNALQLILLMRLRDLTLILAGLIALASQRLARAPIGAGTA